MDVATLKRSRTTAKAKLTRLRNNILKAITENNLEDTVRKRCSDLKIAWEEVQRYHEQYVIQLTEDSDSIEEEWIVAAFNDYESTEIAVDKYLFEIKKKEAYVLEKIALENKNAEMQLIMMTHSKELKGYQVKRKQEDQKFNNCYQTITEMIHNTKADEIKVNVIRAAEKRLGGILEKISSIHENIEILAEKPDGEVETWYQGILESFNKISIEIDICCDGQEKITNKSVSTSKSIGISLERIKFDIFDGNIRNYPIFKSEFLKHIKPLHHPHEEAVVLKSYIAVDIRKDVENIDSIEEIWKRLDKRYGDEGKLIDSIMFDIKRLKVCRNIEDTLILIETLEKAHRDLQILGMEKEISNSTIVSMVEERLPEDIMEKWVEIVTGDDRINIGRDKFPALMKLLLQFKERIEYRRSGMRKSDQRKIVNVADGRLKREINHDMGSKRPWCWLHPNSNDHPIWRCKLFESKSGTEKMELLRLNNACFSCLTVGHRMIDCWKGLKCRIDSCGMNHNTLLHESHTSGITFHGKTLSNSNSKTNGNTLLLLQKISVKRTSEERKEVGLNCLWDGGSNLSFITLRKAKELQLRGKSVDIQIVKVGGTVENITTFWYTIFLVDKFRAFVPINVIGIECISSEIESVNMDNIVEIFKIGGKMKGNLKQSDIKRPHGGDVECLIGYEYAGLHPVRIESIDNLLLLDNRFGLVVGGTHPRIKDGTKKVLQNGVILRTNICICVEQFYNIEQLGIQCTPRCGNCRCGTCHPGGLDMTLKEERELRLIENNLTYDKKEMKWTAAYPFIRDPAELPNNREIILKLLYKTEKRLLSKPKLAVIYQEQIEDMKNRNVCRKLTEEEICTYDGPIHYIAHHEVWKPESESTPCRIVYNISLNYKGHVLNEYYAKGPDVLNNMMGVLLRFREELFAMVGDISKMFHSIKLTTRDQMMQLFLWRDLKLYQAVDTYAIMVVNFGCKPSGAIAVTVLRKTAEMSNGEYPDASSAIVRSSYMDDILTGAESTKERCKLRDDIDAVLHKGGFKIKKWVFSKNFKDIDQQCVEEESPAMVKDSSADEGIERVLGMVWDTNSDKLSVQMKKNIDEYRKESSEAQGIVTKRHILSHINGIHDPLGLVGPVTVRAKILMRRLWVGEEKVGWDDIVSEDITKEWKILGADLKEVSKVIFNRCIKPKNAVGKPSLIIFSDGSKSAYGAVAYARWKTADGMFVSNIIASKNRIAPAKTVDIVRLELAGAVIGKRLRVFIEK